MRHLPRRLVALTVLAAVALGILAVAFPVLAKEALDAQLDAPIARGTPGGTTLLLGVTVTVTEESGTHAVDGSPIYVRLTGPDGASSWDLAAQDRAGHYVVRLSVPPSGVKRVEVGMHGTSDLPLNLVGFTIVPGPISARTAQVAPAIAAATQPLARASAPAPHAVPPAVPAVDPTTTFVPVAAAVVAGPVPLIVGTGALLALALAIVAIVRRHRATAQLPTADRAPEV